MPSDIDPRFYVEDMIKFASRVQAYTSGIDKTAWVDDSMRYDATLRNLELIGEAAGRVPKDIRDNAPGIPWREIISTRNRVIHAYRLIDDDTLWDIVRNDIPALLPPLRSLLDSIPAPD